MKVYLVGGAVRDKLLGLPIRERDWVVVGATPEEMLRQGFKKVGKDFPVFLHPKTHEEYALARTEKKTGKGYKGFICHADPNVSLEDDLKRRDLTINAMAKDQKGKIIDPHDGHKDLKKKILRHVSPAFSEDPVRILRIARFASRFGDFKVASATNALMKKMLEDGEVDALVPERVWQEFKRSLKEEFPERFFMVLKRCGVLPKLFPEIFPHLAKIKKVLKKAVVLNDEELVRFAAIAFSLNKKEIEAFCKRYKTPKVYRDSALLTIKLKNKLLPLSKSTNGIIAILEASNAYRNIERLKHALMACQANDGRLKAATSRLLKAYEITKKVSLTPKEIISVKSSNIAKFLHDKRKKRLEKGNI